MLKKQAEQIIKKIEEFYYQESTITKLKQILKYSGTGNIDLHFTYKYNKETKSSNHCFSISILDIIPYRININKSSLSFTFSSIYFPNVEKRTIKLNSFDDIKPFLFNDVVIIFNYVMQNFTDSFDCCSRYTDCSNCKACTQPLFNDAIRCEYWNKLRNNIIFYGINRNCD